MDAKGSTPTEVAFGPCALRGKREFVFRSRLITLIYVIVGVALAAQKHYLEHFNGWRPVLSAVLAILLWPLLLLGINLHIHR
jgi:hypothetical protein